MGIAFVYQVRIGAWMGGAAGPEPTPALPPPPPGGWRGSEKASVVIGIIIILLTAVIAYPILRGLISGVEGPYEWAALLALAALGAVGVFVAVGGVTRVRKWWRRRRKPEVSGVNPDRITELQIIEGRAEAIWSPSSTFAYGLNFASLSVFNEADRLIRQSPGTSADQKREALNRAQFAILGWRASGSTADAVLWEVKRLVGDVRTTDPGTFVSSVLMLRQLVLGSIAVANLIAQESRNQNLVAGSPFAEQQWADFRERANRLSEDLSTLGERIKHEYEIGDVNFYFPSIWDVAV